MRLLFTTLTILLSISLQAQLEINVNPSNPVKGESFNVIFEVTTESDEEPFVSFTPVGVDVLDRSREVSLSTSIINGKFSSTKKIKIIYEMISDNARVARLKDIKVELKNKALTHDPVRIRILAQKRTPRKIFLQAELSKEQVYIGEGIDVRYYLYSRVPVVQTEFKSFPKLNGFIKRFHQVNDREETVQYDGVVYRKSLKYSARVYPEEIGTQYIDPLRLNIQYATSSGSPFGSLGLSFNRFQSKGVNSSKVAVKVLPLPSENVPANFTGLVGKHEFKFSLGKSKYVVNEAIEGRLEVTGPGALEKLEAPSIFKSPALEQFDTKSDFYEVGKKGGRKVFEYTYLARADVTIPQREMTFSYFNPATKSYEETSVAVPELIVGGGSGVGQIATPENDYGTTGQEKVEKEITQQDLSYSISAPLFTKAWKGIPQKWPKYLMGLFIVIIFAQLSEAYFSRFMSGRKDSSVDNIIRKIKKNGLAYSDLIQLLYMLERSSTAPSSLSVKQIIESSNLSASDKKYFKEAVEALEQKSFSNKKDARKRLRFRKSAFKALKREIGNESA